ncbi:porin [Noviherbaspirillum aerium]|uniref:porin n=1 Tax=Noviherbaspirillum aerium TaxID=2588497 RepID=UPI00298FDB71|nr:porin [Noviherbaspirillum aerium]
MMMHRAVALGLAAVVLPAAAQTTDSVQIYGRLNITAESVRASRDSAGESVGRLNRLANNRSVLGFRGAEVIGGGYQALWQIESAVSVDTGTGSFAGRDTRLGLAAPWGTLFAGNWTTPYTSATQGLDPFYPTTAGYMSIMGNGSAPSSDNVLDTSSFDRRQRNSIHYWTPEWNGVSVRVAHGLAEEKTAVRKPSLTSLAAIYEKGPLYLTYAHERHEDYQGAGLTDTGHKIGAAYRFGPVRVGGAVERLRYQTSSGPLERTAYYLSASYQAGAHGVRLGVARANDGKGSSIEQVGPLRSGSDTGATHLTIGYDYAFSKRTTFYTYASRIDNERNGNYDFAINELGAGRGATVDGIAIGLRHAF